jgi:pyroglutamyl-peptidase
MLMRNRPARPVRILVTGFGPFPGVPDNASAPIVAALARSAAAPGVELTTEIIPVLWAYARGVARDAIARAKPHAILHFGVAKELTGFEIETRALNLGGPKEDCAGAVRPCTPLDISGKRMLDATLPAAILLHALRQEGLPAQISRNAGRYLCNALFYWSLADARPGGPLVSFIHMPAFSAEVLPRLTPKEAAAGARVLVRAAAQAVLLAKESANGRHRGLKSDGSQAFHGTERNSRSVARYVPR